MSNSLTMLLKNIYFWSAKRQSINHKIGTRFVLVQLGSLQVSQDILKVHFVLLTSEWTSLNPLLQTYPQCCMMICTWTLWSIYRMTWSSLPASFFNGTCLVGHWPGFDPSYISDFSFLLARNINKGRNALNESSHFCWKFNNIGKKFSPRILTEKFN